MSTALLTIAALLCLTGYQVTGETAGTRLLSRLAAALAELDRWLPAHHEDLALLARDRPQSHVPLHDFPIAVSLPASEVAGADLSQLRSRILDRLGEVLYRQGMGAFRDDAGHSPSLDIVEPVRWSVTLLQQDANRVWLAALPVATLLLVAAVAVVLSNGASPLPALAAGAGAAALVFAAGWGAAQLVGSVLASPVDREIMLIARDGAWIGLRNSLAVLLATGSFMLLRATLAGQRIVAERRGLP